MRSTAPATGMKTPTRPTRRVVFQVLTVLALLAAAVWLLAHTDYRIDIDVYRMGGRAWLDGTPLYAEDTEFHTQAGIDLPFTYPPLAAVMFAPFAWLPLPVAGALITVVTLALLVLSTKIVLTSLDVGADAAQRWWLAAAISAPAAVLLEPLHANFDFGQINVVLMTLVLADCATKATRWPRGMLIGVAIALKLTPAVFLLYFVLRRDLRAAAVALGSLLAATAVGFLLAWRDSIQYWTSTIHDTGRIGTPTLNTNQNISAALARLSLGDDARFAVWALCCLLVLALTVWAGRRAVAAGQPLLTLICVALFGLAVSPVSWSHHWVWALPTLITTAVLARRWASTALGVLTGVGLILMTSYPILLMPEHHEAQAAWWRQLVGTSYLWWALAVIATVGFVCGARLSRPRNPEAGTTTGSGSGAAASRPL